MSKVRKKHPTKVIIAEIIFVVAAGVVTYLARDYIPSVELITFTFDRFIDSANALNTGLIFAMFLAVFMSENGVSIKDAKKHSAFVQPVVVILANSIMLCVLALLSADERWINVSLVIAAAIFLAVNTKYAWDMLKLGMDNKT